MTLILFPLIFVLCLYLLSIIFSKFLELDNYEKPLFSLGFIVIILNYLYLNLNFSMNYIFNIILAFVLIGAIFSIKEIKKISFKLLLIPIISFSQEKEFDFDSLERPPIYPGCEPYIQQLRSCFQRKIQIHINKNFKYVKDWYEKNNL